MAQCGGETKEEEKDKYNEKYGDILKSIGGFETECFLHHECDSQLHQRVCPKNPGHRNFIMASHFTQDDLPEYYRCEKLFELVRKLIFLTVRIIIPQVSPNRPPKFPYSGYHGRDLGLGLMGTGVVSSVRVVTDKPCRCAECREKGPNAKTKWWMVKIKTVAHNLCDKFEAQGCRVEMFYDNENRDGIVTMDSFEDEKFGANSNYDLSLFNCATHDEELGSTLGKEWLAFNKAWRDVRRFIPGDICRPGKRDLTPPLVVIASHPHGRCKHVTVGSVTMIEKAEGYKSKFMLGYDADTCRGSSGAHVMVISSQDQMQIISEQNQLQIMDYCFKWGQFEEYFQYFSHSRGKVLSPKNVVNMSCHCTLITL